MKEIRNVCSTYEDRTNLADSRQYLVVEVGLHDLPFGGIPGSLEGSHELAVLLGLARSEFDAPFDGLARLVRVKALLKVVLLAEILEKGRV